MRSMATKREYLETVRKRYRESSTREQKSIIIDEVQSNLGRDRKHVIKILNRATFKYRKRKTRKCKYTYDLKKLLIVLWRISGYACSKRLKPQIPELIRVLKKFNEIELSAEQEKLLCEMGTSVIDKFLKHERHRKTIRGISTTKRGHLLKSQIEIRTGSDGIDSVGFLEADCVSHCGSDPSGVFASTLNIVDIHTHWTEKDIFLNKNATKVVGALHVLRKRFPFDTKSVDFDNGDEFVNWHMYRYCKKEGIGLTRARVKHSNDQAHIEERNDQCVRKVIGYDRISSEEIVSLISDMYRNELRLLTNFFYTTMRLESKCMVGSRVVKKYSKALTPYRRVLGCSDVRLSVKYSLMREYEQLNPAQLVRSLDVKLSRLKRLLSVSFLNQATVCKK